MIEYAIQNRAQSNQHGQILAIDPQIARDVIHPMGRATLSAAS